MQVCRAVLVPSLLLALLPIITAFVNSPSSLCGIRSLRAGNQDDDEALTPTTAVIRKVLDALRDSPYIAKKHAEHCESPTVTHLFKRTPLANLPEDLKLSFVTSGAGRALAAIMSEEQNHLGEWKIDMVRDAAGRYDADEVRGRIEEDIASSPVVVYSFIDCPWCVAAKNLLNSEPYDASLVRIIELEDLGRLGKHIRAELAYITGRTSMPCTFVNGVPVGGYTDGAPCGSGLLTMHESGELKRLLLHHQPRDKGMQSGAQKSVLL